jgi:hypothetical protein
MANHYWRFNHFSRFAAIALTGYVCMTLVATAANQNPLVYDRSALTISAPAEPDKAPAAPLGEILVEQRAPKFFQQPGQFFTRALLEDEAYLEPVAAGEYPFLQQANVFTPMDVVIINRNGTVSRLFPSLVLNELPDAVGLPEDTQAVLYLSAGRAEKLGIVPGSVLGHPLFSKAPVMLKEAAPQ